MYSSGIPAASGLLNSKPLQYSIRESTKVWEADSLSEVESRGTAMGGQLVLIDSHGIEQSMS